MIAKLFVGRDEYELQRQATPAGREAIDAVCRETLATLATLATLTTRSRT